MADRNTNTTPRRSILTFRPPFRLRASPTVRNQAMRRVLKAHLKYPARADRILIMIEKDIVGFLREARGVRETLAILQDLWPAFLSLADHDRSNLLVEALINVSLDERVLRRVGDYGVRENIWMGLVQYGKFMIDLHQDFGHETDDSWKAFHSFYARLCATGWGHLNKIWEYALNNSLERRLGEDAEVTVWIATEWLIRCSSQIRQACVMETRRREARTPTWRASVEESRSHRPTIEITDIQSPRDESPVINSQIDGPDSSSDGYTTPDSHITDGASQHSAGRETYGIERWKWWVSHLEDLFLMSSKYHSYGLSEAMNDRIFKACCATEEADKEAQRNGLS